MKLKPFIHAAFFSVLLICNGCEKWRNNRETVTSENHTLAEAHFNDVFNYMLIAASPGGDLLQDTCFAFTKSSNSFPMDITIDLGQKGCKGLFDFDTYGKIRMTITDSIGMLNAVITGTPDELYIRGYKVEGAVTITNIGLGASGKSNYSFTVTNALITAVPEEAGEDISLMWQCNYQIEVIEDNSSAFLIDDLHLISGSASGMNEEGRSYTATIKEPLRKYVNCRWPGSGKTTIAATDLKERDLNYGVCTPGNCCDNEAIEEVRWTDKTVRMR